jgi:hypothetical protein
MRVMLDATPRGAQFWDKSLQLVDCNQATIRLFNLASKQEYLEKFDELSP